MKNKRAALLSAILCYSSVLCAQVQVRKEPRHKNALENKYIRLLDVKIQPGDTSLFHIHSTPSVFLHFTNTVVCSQIKGRKWETAKNTEGNASYRSFANDTLIHRVSNCDTVPFHVTDVELLSPYKPTEKREAMPFRLLFENERVFAYQLTDSSFKDIPMGKRGPLIAEVVTGEVLYSDIFNRKSKRIKTGKYLYIEPGKIFSFAQAGKEKTMMVLVEIK